MSYGNFFNTSVDFVLVALAIFMLVKAMSKLQPKPVAKPAAPPATRECPQCLETLPIKASRCKFCTSVIGG